MEAPKNSSSNSENVTTVQGDEISSKCQPQSSYFYSMLNNIPASFHTTDLRNFFSEHIENEKFDMFHYRPRPQIVSVAGASGESADVKVEDNTSSSSQGTSSKHTSVKIFCCLIRFKDDLSRSQLIKRYHMRYWMDKEGEDLSTRCIITKVNLSQADLQRFSSKELHPPKLMPRGNIGTPNAHFLNLIRECRLPPSLITKLGLEFPRARVFKRYSKVPMDYGTGFVRRDEYEEEEEEVKTGKGHVISDLHVPKNPPEGEEEEEQSGRKKDSDEESHADDDEDRYEEWERHEALHDHRTTHGDVTSESKERLYESEIELQWEKGGPGLVWYTDAQFWDQQRGSFEERTADDWDVDQEGYYEPGGGDQDAHDLMDIRRSQRIQQGLETISVVRKNKAKPSYTGLIKIGTNVRDSNIGMFEKHTRGIGRKVMERFGWKDGEGLGKTIIGMPDALESEGQGPADKRGFGFYGEKLDLGNPSKRRMEFKDYQNIEAEDRIVIGTVYDKPEDLDIPEPLKRRNAPTFVKRYEFCKASTASKSSSTSSK